MMKSMIMKNKQNLIKKKTMKIVLVIYKNICNAHLILHKSRNRIKIKNNNN